MTKSKAERERNIEKATRRKKVREIENIFFKKYDDLGTKKRSLALPIISVVTNCELNRKLEVKGLLLANEISLEQFMPI